MDTGSVLALFGVFLTATVAIVGHWIRRSIEERNAELRRQETTVSVFELLKSASGEVTPGARAGVLCTLTNLGNLDFALALVDDFWSNNQVKAPVAVAVLNTCLGSESAEIQEKAADILHRYAERLPNGRGGLFWPSDFRREWGEVLAQPAKESLLHALMDVFPAKECKYWDDSVVEEWVEFAKKLRENELDPVIRDGASRLMVQLLKYYPEVQRPEVAEIQAYLDEAEYDPGVEMRRRQNQMDDWIGDCAGRKKRHSTHTGGGQDSP